jgi:hypothetical protein
MSRELLDYEAAQVWIGLLCGDLKGLQRMAPERRRRRPTRYRRGLVANAQLIQ